MVLQPLKNLPTGLKGNQTPDLKMANYNQQAADFLQATATQLNVKFTKHGKHFADDKENRDIFRVTLKNKKHTFRFNFGQSISQSTGTGENMPPAYDILSCLTHYEVDTFDNFCRDFGYDADSRKAYKIYKAVLREWKNIELLFTPDEIELLQEIN